MDEPERQALSRAWHHFSDTALDFGHRIRETPIQRAFDFSGWIAAYEAQLKKGARIPVDLVSADLIEAAFASGVHITHPRHFGLFNPPVWPEAVLGEAIAGLFNFQLSTDYLAPFACALERWTIGQLGARLCGPWASAQFTNGGSEANLTAVASALAWAFPDAPERGIAAVAPTARLYVGAEAHDSFVKIGKMTGIGAANVIKAPANDDGQTDVDSLRRQISADIASGARPFMIVSTIGATASGACDDTVELAGLARANACWLHVDAAWAGGAALSPRRQALFAGVELADSLTWDAHKWLCVPLPTGMVFTRHPDALAAAFGLTADYMPPSEGVADLFRTGVPWSRRALGLRVFLTLASRGWDAFEQQIEHQFAIGDYLRQRLGESGWEIVNRTELPLVCFVHPARRNAEDVRKLVDALVTGGRFWLSSVRLVSGAQALRACVTSPETTHADVDALVEELARLI